MAPGDLERGAETVQLTAVDEDKRSPNDTCYTKEELEELSNTSCWNMARKVLLIGFWLLWMGAIAWSVIIVVNSPKCKAEPKQAWFTKGAIGAVNGENALNEIEAIEAGKYSGFLIKGIIPALGPLLEMGDVQGLVGKLDELIAAGENKDAKVLHVIDVTGATDQFDKNRYQEYFQGYLAASDGFVFRGANKDVVTAIREAREDNAKHDIFYEVFDQGFSDIVDTLTEKEYLYKSLAATCIDAKSCLEEAKSVIDNTFTYSNGTVVETAVETLWEGNDSILDSSVLAATLPGGFVLPTSIQSPNAAAYTVLNEMRQQYHSLRAIIGSSISFASGGFKRTFDLRPTIEVTDLDYQDRKRLFTSENATLIIY